MSLTREQCLKYKSELYFALKHVGTKSNKISIKKAISLGIVGYEKLIKEHFELVEEYKHLKKYYGLRFFENMTDEDGFFYNIKGVFESYCFVDKKMLNEKAIALHNEMKRFVEWIKEKDNQPLKFEELKPGMWVWDNEFNHWGEYLKIFEVKIDKYNQKTIKTLCVGNDEVMIRSYKENRFYRYEVKEND